MGRACDVVVIGGGILGMATARELLRRRPGTRLLVLEKEARIARHQTGRNSGVIHSGIYYVPGSLKAQLCVAGKQKLLRYCDEKNIPYNVCGKVIVATEEAELPRLDELHRRGLANGVEGLEVIGPERLREIEPRAAGIRALYAPKTGIVDYSKVAESLAQEIAACGGEILTGHGVKGIQKRGGRFLVETSSGVVEAKHLLSCAGLHSDRIARMTGAPATPRIVPFRGDYYLLHPRRRDWVRGLIYPVPDPRFPFLGVHFTPRMDGQVLLGPNAVLALAREGYGRLTIRPRDLAETLAYSGFRRLARRYWRTGIEEIARDFRKTAFLKALRRYMPDLRGADLSPGPAGVRAQALAEDGTLVDDFAVDAGDGALHVRNAPSPAATSSLAIAELIADRAETVFAD